MRDRRSLARGTSATGTAAAPAPFTTATEVLMKLSDFLKKVEGMDPDTILCVAEVDEAFGSEIEDVEILDNARQRSPDAADMEAIELANGDQKAVVIRW
jgi:hypothetical protein